MFVAARDKSICVEISFAIPEQNICHGNKTNRLSSVYVWSLRIHVQRKMKLNVIELRKVSQSFVHGGLRGSHIDWLELQKYCILSICRSHV